MCKMEYRVRDTVRKNEKNNGRIKNGGYIFPNGTALGSCGHGKLENARVAVFGIGGVGGYAAEALARSGVGALDLIDNDRVASTNLNRQIIAIQSTVGKLKTEVAGSGFSTSIPRASSESTSVFSCPKTRENFLSGNTIMSLTR